MKKILLIFACMFSMVALWIAIAHFWHTPKYAACIGMTGAPCAYSVAWKGCASVLEARQVAEFGRIAMRGASGDLFVCQSTPRRAHRKSDPDLDDSLIPCNEVIHCSGLVPPYVMHQPQAPDGSLLPGLPAFDPAPGQNPPGPDGTIH